jgi:hypothetical protein
LIQKDQAQKIAAHLIIPLIREEKEQQRIPKVREMRTVSQIRFREN